MTKVHPNATLSKHLRANSAAACGEAAALTVWRKSLLFHGDGFTVFDAKGNLVFRVDNYSSGNRGEIVLMDAAGKPIEPFLILSDCVQKLSLGDHWLIYDGEEAANPQFAVKKPVNFINSRSLAHVTPSARANSRLTYEVEGSYSRRCCAVYDERHRQLAQIKLKESASGVAFGADVFRLVLEPGFDAAFAMGIVIVLEQMFGSRGSLIRV